MNSSTGRGRGIAMTMALKKMQSNGSPPGDTLVTSDVSATTFTASTAGGAGHGHPAANGQQQQPGGPSFSAASDVSPAAPEAGDTGREKLPQDLVSDKDKTCEKSTLVKSSIEMFAFHKVQNAVNEINVESVRSAQSEANAKPEFKPEYSMVQSDRDKAINAMIEIRAIWDYVIKDANYIYSNIYPKLTIPLSKELQQECQKYEFAVYDKITDTWLVKSSDEPEFEEPQYTFCYADEGFDKFENAKSEKGLLLVGNYTVIKQEPNLLECTETAPAMFGKFELPTLTLVAGVPGCGKTTYIIEHHQPGSLVLTSCSEGAQDVRNRMAAKLQCNPWNFKNSYRTMDSYLINSRAKYHTVWVDEALMVHPGKLFLVCLYSGCRTMHMLGDPHQLGYINRVEGIPLFYHISSIFFTPLATLNISYRCPVDVIALISHKYSGGAYSTSEVMQSMECKVFTELECVPKLKDVKYLVFKQVEKQIMKKAKYNVSTVHEFQGKEVDDVIVVRMSRKVDEPLYKSLPHILVGMSRHKKSLVYYTPVEDDMKKLIETPLTLTDLEKVKKTVK